MYKGERSDAVKHLVLAEDHGFGLGAAIKNLGMGLASRDPVAIDAATLDLKVQKNGRNLGTASYPEHDALIQLRHAAKVGLGQLEYELITVE